MTARTMNAKYRQVNMWLVIVACLVGTAIILMPSHDVPFYMDDWDFLWERFHLSFAEYVFKVNPEGQFNPLYKLIYALLLAAFDYSNWPLLLMQFLCRAATILCWAAILKRLQVVTWAGIVLLLAIGINGVGAGGVFRLMIQGGQEFALLFFTLAIYFLLHYEQQQRLLAVGGSSLCLLAGALCWGNGLVPPLTIALSYGLLAFFRRQEKSLKEQRAALFLLALAPLFATTLYLLQNRPANMALANAPHQLAGVARYFFYEGIVNGALSGLAPGGVLPGLVHLVYFLLLLVGVAWFLGSTASREAKFVMGALFLTEVALSLLIAVSRYDRGIWHASSYRYVYNNLFFQLPMLALLLGQLANRKPQENRRAWFQLHYAPLAVAMLIFGLGVYGGLRERAAQLRIEAGQCECLQDAATGQMSAKCVGALYYRQDAAFVVRVWAELLQRFPQRNGITLRRESHAIALH